VCEDDAKGLHTRRLPVGLRDCLHLRVKDVDFEPNQICVRGGKGGEDRHMPLPRRLCDPLTMVLFTMHPLIASKNV
jgi:integrase